MPSLSNPSDWLRSWEGSFTATLNPGGQTFTAIAEQFVPGSFESPLLAIVVKSSTAKPHWRFAGYANQRIDLGFSDPTIADTNGRQSRKKLWLRQANLLYWPPVSEIYRVSLEVPIWLQSIEYDLWQFSGGIFASGDASAIIPAIETAQDETELSLLQIQVGIQQLQQILNQPP
ncbi:MAG: hypothetical protein HC910_21525 [Spirulinaceae cyanobacterium SM2_1_0]|nr:hypothetical protein [Spirulinaceae cyanobacterium SM2_1_0]